MCTPDAFNCDQNPSAEKRPHGLEIADPIIISLIFGEQNAYPFAQEAISAQNGRVLHRTALIIFEEGTDNFDQVIIILLQGSFGMLKKRS